jgi:sialic acid synthase
MKGSDQKGSLGIDGLNRMVRDIRNLEYALKGDNIDISEAAISAKNKLERSIATIKDLRPGHIISENDLHLLSPGDGLMWTEKNKIIGRKVKNCIPKNEIIYERDLK